MKCILSIILVASILGPCLGAQLVPPLPEDYDAVLIPLAPQQVPGAQGSRWSYELGLLNAGTETLVGYFFSSQQALPPPDIFPTASGCLFPICPSDAKFLPGYVYRNSLLGFDRWGQSGLLLYVRKSATPMFRFQLRVKDVSRSELSAGAEVQPIPVSRFIGGPIQLLYVPADPRFRLTLRVYDPRPVPDNFVRIKVFDQEATVIHEATYPLRQPQDALDDMYPGFPRHPDFLQLSDIPLGTSGVSVVRIEVESLTGRPIWAFVSITNNETQEFTVVSPYRGD